MCPWTSKTDNLSSQAFIIIIIINNMKPGSYRSWKSWKAQGRVWGGGGAALTKFHKERL